jgi:hypothetical protein
MRQGSTPESLPPFCRRKPSQSNNFRLFRDHELDLTLDSAVKTLNC